MGYFKMKTSKSNPTTSPSSSSPSPSASCITMANEGNAFGAKTSGDNHHHYTDVPSAEEWQISQHPLSSSSTRFATRNIADWLLTRQETTGLSLATRRHGYPIQPQHLASSVAWYVLLYEMIFLCCYYCWNDEAAGMTIL